MNPARLTLTSSTTPVSRVACLPMTLVGFLVLALGVFAAPSRAQSLPIYTDSLQSGFQDWSWTTRNLANTAPVQSGADSISVTFGAWQGLSLHSGSINTTYYSALSFWVNGGATGGQKFTVHAVNASGSSLPSVPVTNYVPGGSIPANSWVQVTVPLADLGAANLTDFDGFWFQDSTGGAQPVLYVDTISLLGLTAPAVVHVNVQATQTVQVADSRDFGVNTAIWDGYLDSPNTQSLMSAAGASAFRFPGGSWGDTYDFTKAMWNGIPMTSAFGDLLDKTGTPGSQAFIIVNYGSGSPQMAAAWVAYCNSSPSSAVAIGLDSAGRDWKTAGYWAALRGASPISPDDGLNVLRANHPVPYGVKNWELGNECFGSWENDTHTPKQDPVIYAGFVQSATALMKQVDPTIRTGAVITGAEDDWGNQTETVTNPVTGVAHKGWTPNVLATLNTAGFVPDFVILHNYPSGSDAALLEAWPWTSIAVPVRTMLTQYCGAAATASVQLCATENNTQTNGKQGTSLVDGLYYAESIGGLLQTEFRSLLWWDTHNGVGTSGDNSSNYYGWRLYDDGGMIASGGGLPGSALDTPYPAYFALKLASKFARGGDVVVGATSDYPLLNAFAAKRANGGLSLLIVNTDPNATVNTAFSISGYSPTGTATQYQYGEAEDTMQSTGVSVDLTQSPLSGVGPTFTTTFPPYSMSVITLAPVLPTTTALLSGTASANGWYKSAVQVTLLATSGSAWHIASTNYAVDGGSQQTYSSPFTVSGDGTHTITYYSVDSAGNTGTVNTATFKIDATAPTLLFGAASPVANGNGWNNGPSPSPTPPATPTSGVASATPGSPLTFSTEGARTKRRPSPSPTTQGTQRRSLAPPSTST